MKLTDSNNESIFEKFYKDKDKYSYVFQSYVLLSRVKHILETREKNPDKIIICERCHMTDLEIFAKTLFEKSHFTDMEWIVYNQWHDMLNECFKIPVNAHIYIRTTPDVCMERIKKRNRQSEDKITTEYLETIHKRHEEWLMDTKYNKIPTLVLDGNHDIFENTSELNSQIKQIEMFINAL